MPLDPNISLSYQPPQIQNPLSTLAQVQALKNQQLQSQSSQLELQNQQRTLAGQQALDNAMRTAVTMGPDGTPVFNRQAVSDSLSQGGFGHLVPGVMKSLTDTETAYADLAKKKADLTKLNQDIAQNNVDAGGLLGLTVQKAGNTPGAALGAIAFAKAHGQLDPATAESFAQRITANPTTDAVKQLTDNLIAQSPKAQTILKGQQEAAAATQQAETRRQAEERQQKEFDVKAPGERADAAKKEFQNAVPSLLRAVGTPAYAQAVQALSPDAQKIAPPPETNPTIADVTRASMTPAEAQTAAHQTVEEKQTQQRIGLEARRTAAEELQAQLAKAYMPTTPGAQNLTGEEYLKTLSPAIGNQIRQIANGEQEAPSPSSRNPQAAAIRQAVNQYDPTFNDNRRKAMIEYTTGGKSKPVDAINTAIGHLDLLGEAAKALRNGSFVPGNEVYNRFASTFGAPDKTNVDSIIQRVSGELNKATGSISEGEQEAIKKNLHSGMSAQQLEGAVRTNIGLLGEAMDTQKQDYMRATGFKEDSPKVKALITPRAQQALTKMGIDPITMKPAATGVAGIPAGIPSDAIVQRSKANPNQYRYSTDGGKTWQTPTNQ